MQEIKTTAKSVRYVLKQGNEYVEKELQIPEGHTLYKTESRKYVALKK